MVCYIYSLVASDKFICCFMLVKNANEEDSYACLSLNMDNVRGVGGQVIMLKLYPYSADESVLNVILCRNISMVLHDIRLVELHAPTGIYNNRWND